MIFNSLARVITILIVIQFCASKLQLQSSKSNSTARSLHTSVKKQNATLIDKPTSSKPAIQIKRTNAKHHYGNKTTINQTANAVSRQINIENFIENHKGAIVRLLKKLLLPKLKARALQPHSFESPLETDPSNKNLDKEAMNYELGYFLGLQKAFKNRQMLMGDSGEDNLVPLRLVHASGSKQAVTDSGPMTGFTSVALPFHKLKKQPMPKSLDAALGHYGMQDPGFLKKLTKADESDILQFAGKHNMDVFAERNNLKGIGDYLAKRNFITRPVNAPSTNEGASQRIKKDDIFGPSVLAEEPDKPSDDGPAARVEAGPNPLEKDPTPLHQIISQADHISSGELHGLLGESGGEKINMKELYSLIEDEEKAKERLEDPDKTPQVGTVYGEDTRVQAENGFRDLPNPEEMTTEQLEQADKGDMDSDVEKRTLKGLLSIIRQNEYEEERDELRHVLRKIIAKLSEIPNNNEKRNLLHYALPGHQNRVTMSRNYIPYYYNPWYRPVQIKRLWRRTVIPKPRKSLVQRRGSLPQIYNSGNMALKTSDNLNDYEFQSENKGPPDLEETGGVEAYALPKVTENPASRLENFVSTPKEESLNEAIALLNRGSSIDDSLGDHLQAGFLQRFVLPNSPSTIYKRNMLKATHNFRAKPRIRRSSNLKVIGKSAKKLKKTKVEKDKKYKKHHGKKRNHQSESNNAMKVMNKETNAEVTNVGSKKHEILRDPTASVLSGLDNYVSPAVFESRSQNFFTSGPSDNSHIIRQIGDGTVMLTGHNSGIGTAVTKPRGYRQHGGFQTGRDFQHKSKYLEQFISSPKMQNFRSASYPASHSRSGFVGNRRISPALEIYNDNSVSTNGDLPPVMEVKSMRPNGAMPEQTGSEQLMQEVVQGAPEVAQKGNSVVQSEMETEGQGKIEIGSKYEVEKSPSVQDGNMESINEDLLAQQNSQVIEDPKGDERTGANAMAVEEISGETKQAISNTLAALDKQGIAQAKLGGDTLATAQIYGEQLPAHPLSDNNMVQTYNQASKGLNDDLLIGPSARHIAENRVPNHVYLPDEDFDGIDWKKIHQPVHGPLGYDATSKEDIRVLSDPFFAPGVGEPIGDHSKPTIIAPSPFVHSTNPYLQRPIANGSQIAMSTPSVTDAKSAPSAILKADAVNTVKALTNTGTIEAIPGANVAAPVNTPASAVNVPGVVTNPSAPTVTAGTASAQAVLPSSQPTGPLLSKAAQQIHAHDPAVHEMHQSIASNAELSAVQIAKSIADTAQNATNAHYITDVKDAAVTKINDNNAHAAQLHQLANTITAQNAKIATTANKYLNNAVAAAAHDIDIPVSHEVGNVTNNKAGHIVSSYNAMHSLEDPYSSVVRRLEDEANKAADLHHDSLHMGTYVNKDVANALDAHSVSNLLSHDHIDANMHSPVIIGDVHTVAEQQSHNHDAYPYHWNHVELESHPQVVDMSPMTPGGIHFMTNTLGNDLDGVAGIAGTNSAGTNSAGANSAAAAAGAAGAGVNAAGANAAGANAAGANAAGANAAAGAGVNAAGANAAGANAAGANAAAGANSAAGANAAGANAAGANAAASPAAAGAAAATGPNAAGPNAVGASSLVNAAASNAASASASITAAKGGSVAATGAGGVVQPGAVAGAAANSASGGFIGGNTEASNIGNSGGMMKQGANLGVGAGSVKATGSLKNEISDNGVKDGYPDINNDDNDKRNMTNMEESFDSDASKTNEPKVKAQKGEKADEGNSGFDASTGSTASKEGGSEINFDTEKTDDFKMDDSTTQQDSELNGKTTMQFNQTNDEDASGAGSEELKTDRSLENPTIGSDDKTASLQIGNLKESRVENFTNSAESASEVEGDFVTESDTAEQAMAIDGHTDEAETNSDTSENGESRSGEKQTSLYKARQKGETIQSDEAIRGNRYSPKHKAQMKSKGDKARSNKHLIESLQKKLIAGKKHIVGKKRLHRPMVKSKWKKPLLKIKGHSTKAASKLENNKSKLDNTTEFFLGSARKHSFKNKKGNTSEFEMASHLNEHAKDISSKHNTTSEFFIIKTNNLTSDEPISEESLFTKNDSKGEFITGAKKNIVDDLADFQLSDSAKKHLLPDDLDKLARLHRMLSIAQINFLKKEEPIEVGGMIRTLRPKEAQQSQITAVREDNHGETIQGKYRSAIKEALKQIEGVKKSLTDQEDEQKKGKQPQSEKYRNAIHEALREVEAVKKSLMQTSSSSTKLLTNALAISNLANLLRESTNIFNKAYGTISNNYPNVAANMVTGDLISPGTSGLLINPAGSSTAGQSQKLPSVATQKSTKDIYAEIGSPAMVQEENSDKKSLQASAIATHTNGKHPGIRTIKETKRQKIGKN